ncbi:hypothetical protein D3C81_2017450 [compost metagenome]
MQGIAKAGAQTGVFPAQLALGDRVKVLQMALAIDDQQAVVNAVEHRLQALLAG